MPSQTKQVDGTASTGRRAAERGGGGGRGAGDGGRGAGDRGRGAGDRNAPSLASRWGPIELDWPRSLGFFGGISLAVAAGLIEPPLGVCIAAVPFVKMLDLPGLPNRLRFVAQIFEGASKPIGGDSEGTIRVVTTKGASDQPVQSGS